VSPDHVLKRRHDIFNAPHSTITLDKAVKPIAQGELPPAISRALDANIDFGFIDLLHLVLHRRPSWLWV
jgi:hypothetical protein